MRMRRVAALLVVICILVGCAPSDESPRDYCAESPGELLDQLQEEMPTGKSFQDYCSESQREFLNQTQADYPVELIFHCLTETDASYKTTDEEIISEILQVLRGITVVSKSSIRSTDNRILEFVTEEGDTCSFRFDGRLFQGSDNACYVLSGDDKLWQLARTIREEDPEYQKLIR